MSADRLKRLIDETDATPEPADRPLTDAVIAERLYRASRPTRYMAFLFMAGLFAAFWHTLQGWQMALCFAFNLGGTLWFDHLRRRFASRPDPFAAADVWTTRFALASAVTGTGWGLLGWFAFAPDNFESQLTLGFAMCGLITLSVLTRSVHLPSYYTFMAATLTPPLLRCLIEGTPGALTIAFCGVVFVIFTSIWSHNAHDRELRSAALRLRNAELIHEVEQARAMAETARDLAEDNYHRTLDSLQNAQRIGNVGNWDWYAATDKLFWSDQLYRLIGKAPGSMTPDGEAFLALVDAEDRDRVTERLKEVTRSGTRVTAEFRLKPIDGETRILFAVTEAMQDETGKIVRIAGTLRDVTQQRDYENALIAAKAVAERASRAKTNFLGNLSHELRTPLNAVIGFAEMLTLPRTGAAGTPRTAEYASLILTSSRELLVLIDDLLDIAQIETGQMELKSETIAMAALIAETAAQAQPALEKADCRLEVSGGGGDIRGDAQRVRQILATLLAETIRLSPPGNRLSLASADEQTMLRLTLTSEAPLPDIAADTALLHGFEARVAYHASDLGLHLALMKELVRRHHGDLRSETRGDGTALHLRLPLAGHA
ncbi:PAS domain-containing sensor histidine kinase [Ferrovibrio terrae]|nr:PAS domain-containing sensor histidine kinase [Ferrovibrio terrae]